MGRRRGGAGSNKRPPIHHNQIKYKAENIEITDADLEFEYAKLAEQYNMKIEDVRKALANNLGEFRQNLKMQRIDDLLFNSNN